MVKQDLFTTVFLTVAWRIVLYLIFMISDHFMYQLNNGKIQPVTFRDNLIIALHNSVTRVRYIWSPGFLFIWLYGKKYSVIWFLFIQLSGFSLMGRSKRFLGDCDSYLKELVCHCEIESNIVPKTLFRERQFNKSHWWKIVVQYLGFALKYLKKFLFSLTLTSF